MSAAPPHGTTLLRSSLWFTAVIGIALGVGGLVGTLDPPPGDATRPELTARKDRAVAGAIASLVEGVATLGDSVAVLRRIGRDALAHVTAGDPERLAADFMAGGGVLDRAASTSDAIRATLAELPAGVERSGLSQLHQARLASVEMALGSVAVLDEAWRRVGPLDEQTGARLDEALIAIESAAGALEDTARILAGPSP